MARFLARRRCLRRSWMSGMVVRSTSAFRFPMRMSTCHHHTVRTWLTTVHTASVIIRFTTEQRASFIIRFTTVQTASVMITACKLASAGTCTCTGSNFLCRVSNGSQNVNKNSVCKDLPEKVAKTGAMQAASAGCAGYALLPRATLRKTAVPASCDEEQRRDRVSTFLEAS